MALKSCECANDMGQLDLLRAIYCALFSINAAVGGDTGSDEFTSDPTLETGDGSIPAGVLGWSITAVSGTVTVNGSALAIGQTVRGGGYGGKTLKTAIAYTITAGSALVTIDTPA